MYKALPAWEKAAGRIRLARCPVFVALLVKIQDGLVSGDERNSSFVSQKDNAKPRAIEQKIGSHIDGQACESSAIYTFDIDTKELNTHFLFETLSSFVCTQREKAERPQKHSGRDARR